MNELEASKWKHTITIDTQNGEMVGTYFGHLACRFAYVPSLRAELERLYKSRRGSNIAFVYAFVHEMTGPTFALRAAQNTVEGARRYMNPDRVLVTFA